MDYQTPGGRGCYNCEYRIHNFASQQSLQAFQLWLSDSFCRQWDALHMGSARLVKSKFVPHSSNDSTNDLVSSDSSDTRLEAVLSLLTF